MPSIPANNDAIAGAVTAALADPSLTAALTARELAAVRAVANRFARRADSLSDAIAVGDTARVAAETDALAELRPALVDALRLVRAAVRARVVEFWADVFDAARDASAGAGARVAASFAIAELAPAVLRAVPRG